MLSVLAGLLLAGVHVGDAWAGTNTVASGTLIFEGTLSESGGTYSGVLCMVDENALGIGDNVAGFDVYAKTGSCALIQNYYVADVSNCAGVETYTIGHYPSPHDAYAWPGGPWGSWYDPDCADWYNFSLDIDGSTWALRQHPGSSSGSPCSAIANGVPMGGSMDWSTGYALETDTGAYLVASPPVNFGDAAAHGAGAGWWDMDWTWGTEAIQLEHPGFAVMVIPLGGGQYRVYMSPSPPLVPATGPGTVPCYGRGGP